MKQIQIIGHLGRDAKKVSGNGNEFVSFTVGVSEKWKDAQNEVKERTDWFNVITKQMTILQWLVKGTQVYVQGSLRASIYQNETTRMNTIDLTVNATTIQLLSSGKKDGEPAPTANAPAANSSGLTF